jgi:hypothetical protein
MTAVQFVTTQLFGDEETSGVGPAQETNIRGESKTHGLSDRYTVEYANFTSQLYTDIRAEVLGEDIGQQSWLSTQRNGRGCSSRGDACIGSPVVSVRLSCPQIKFVAPPPPLANANSHALSRAVLDR